MMLLVMFFSSSADASAQAVAAHRGFWKSEGAQQAQNSIASLREAQDIGVWGSEFDVQITSDGVALVNHDSTLGGKSISQNPLSTFKAMTLKNGEAPSTLDEYLAQGEKSPTVLVLELKPQKEKELEDLLVAKCLEGLTDHSLFDPSRVIFISFSYHICRQLASRYPSFMVQYLEGDKTPEEVYADGIKGIDYHMGVFKKNPDYVGRAHALGMQVNVWTVDRKDDMEYFVELGVDCITTNNPLVAREVIGSGEILPPSLK